MRVLTFIRSIQKSYARAPYDTSSDGGSSSYESDWEAEVNARWVNTNIQDAFTENISNDNLTLQG